MAITKPQAFRGLSQPKTNAACQRPGKSVAEAFQYFAVRGEGNAPQLVTKKSFRMTFWSSATFADVLKTMQWRFFSVHGLLETLQGILFFLQGQLKSVQGAFFFVQRY